MRAESRTQLPNDCLPYFFFYFLFVASLEMSLFPRICVPLPFSPRMESTSSVSRFRAMFSYLVTTGWIFDVSLCESSINQSINPSSQKIDRVAAD